VTTPVVVFTDVIATLVTLYPLGVKPVVVSSEPATTFAGKGVGNVYDETLPAHVAAVAVPNDWLANATVITPVPPLTDVIVAFVTL
jgi:hypothetical protein